MFFYDSEDTGVRFISLQDSLNTTTAQGRLIFNFLASLAEFERDIIRERTHPELDATKARGRTGGRKKVFGPEAQIKSKYVQELYAARSLTIKEIGKRANIIPSKK